MDQAHRIDRLEPRNALALSLGLGSLLHWLWLAQRRAFAQESVPALYSFLFAFGLCCALLSKTNLPGPGNFTRTSWAVPCLMLPLPFFPGLGIFGRVFALTFSAFAIALLVCRWLTLFARFSFVNFIPLYAFATLFATAGRLLPFSGQGERSALLALPFLSTGLLLLATRGLPWLPEGENFPPSTLSLSLILKLFLFALILNGTGTFVRPDSSPLPAVENGAWIFFSVCLVVFVRRRRGVSYKPLMGLSLLLWSLGAVLAGAAPALGLFFITGGCALFEMAFWLLILLLAERSPNPARMVCTGLSLTLFSMISSHLLLQAIPPLWGAEAFEPRTGLPLLIGLLSALLLFLPALRFSETPASAAPPPLSPFPEPEPQPESPASGPEECERLLKTRMEDLGLTRQECRIALMLLKGNGDADVCAALFISKNTLKFHIRNLNRKLGITSRRELPELAERLTSGRVAASEAPQPI